MRKLALVVWLLGAADVLLTEYGLRLGVIAEGNPLMDALFHIHPLVAIFFALALPGTLLLVLLRLLPRSKLATPGLFFLFTVKVGIIGLHAHWLWQIKSPG